MTPDEDVDEFMREAAAIVADLGPASAAFGMIAERLRELGQRPYLLDQGLLSELHGSAASATILARHPEGGPVLMLARFPPEAPTPVHNHNSWGVLCVIGGRDRYQRWERLDDLANPKRAEVRLAEERSLETGDVAWFEGPPQDLHAQQGIGEAAWELVYFGRDPDTLPRAYFDPRTGAVTYTSSIG